MDSVARPGKENLVLAGNGAIFFPRVNPVHMILNIIASSGIFFCGRSRCCGFLPFPDHTKNELIKALFIKNTGEQIHLMTSGSL
jgi:hypothetical protein